MAIFETIPTLNLFKNNELTSMEEKLPELVKLNDSAKSIFTDFAKVFPATIPPKSSIDVAAHEMKVRHQQMLLVEENRQVIGLISFEDILSERPLQLMQAKGLNRAEITVEMLMSPREHIIVLDISHLKNAQVGHIINTIKAHSAYYILVVKTLRSNKHLIKGLFSATQIGKQLHSDLSSILTKEPKTIVELNKERKV
ncbi:MAG: CBS domain-containing protein [Gammaproteobacteria bacterium]|nr:CBS domain-containing protein [Gammaproteobacteria bacterium]